MTTAEEQRLTAAIAWAINNHQIPKSLQLFSNGRLETWNYTGSISNSELRLYEENGPSIYVDRQQIEPIFPIKPENPNQEFGERKFVMANINNQRYPLALHDDNKVSRLNNHFVHTDSAGANVDKSVHYSVSS